MDITTLLSFWGAFLSTFIAGWTLYRDVHDRAKLRLDAMVGKMRPDHLDDDYLFVTFTNVGRRPIMVTKWGMLLDTSKGGKPWALVVPHGLPRMLKEGETHTEWTAELKAIGGVIVALCAWDSKGKMWTTPKSQISKIQNDIQQLLAT